MRHFPNCLRKFGSHEPPQRGLFGRDSTQSANVIGDTQEELQGDNKEVALYGSYHPHFLCCQSTSASRATSIFCQHIFSSNYCFMAVSVILVSLTSFHPYICLVPAASSLKIHCTT